MSRGGYYELKLQKLFEAKGFTVVKSTASRTPIDLIAWNAHDVYFLQCKRAKNAHVASQARYAWKKELGNMVFPQESLVQLWIYGPDASWHVWDWIEGELVAKPGTERFPHGLSSIIVERS